VTITRRRLLCTMNDKNNDGLNDEWSTTINRGMEWTHSYKKEEGGLWRTNASELFKMAAFLKLQQSRVHPPPFASSWVKQELNDDWWRINKEGMNK
jgi:hypothetical protein